MTQKDMIKELEGIIDDCFDLAMRIDMNKKHFSLGIDKDRHKSAYKHIMQAKTLMNEEQIRIKNMDKDRYSIITVWKRYKKQS